MGIVFLWNEVLENQKAFNEYIHHVGAGDAPRAVEAAKRILSGITTTFEKIQQDYPALVVDAQMPDYWDVRKRFEASAPSLRELGSLASQLEHYVSVTELEVDRYRRKEPSFWTILALQGRRIALGAVAALAVWMLGWGVLKIIRRGQGLTAEYYGDTELGAFYRSRVDRTVDFSWGKGSPFLRWHKNNFSIRWTGFLRVPETGHYEFYVHVDDGARLTIDNNLLIDDWKEHKLHVVQTSVDLEAGYHSIRLDYFERSKLATIRLYWKRITSPRPEPIQGRFLVPSEAYLRKGIPVFGNAVAPDTDTDESDEPTGEAPAAGQPASVPVAPAKTKR